MASTLPLFHLYGDPPDDQAFDFIHVETIASRSSIHDWTIRAHRHRNLFQILLIERGGGEMTAEAATLRFAAPAAILMPATVALSDNRVTGDVFTDSYTTATFADQKFSHRVPPGGPDGRECSVDGAMIGKISTPSASAVREMLPCWSESCLRMYSRSN